MISYLIRFKRFVRDNIIRGNLHFICSANYTLYKRKNMHYMVIKKLETKCKNILTYVKVCTCKVLYMLFVKFVAFCEA